VRKLIEVKEEHIKNGNRCSLTYCPIALALKASGYEHVVVSGYDAQISGHFIDLSTRARRFIRKFDSKTAVKPFKFWIFDSEAQ
jgi:hypothetical protein